MRCHPQGGEYMVPEYWLDRHRGKTMKITRDCAVEMPTT